MHGVAPVHKLVLIVDVLQSVECTKYALEHLVVQLHKSLVRALLRLQCFEHCF